ncbi:glycosyltransferase family 87 protein [Paludisphaera mucosa]|uniref:Glycosyltransferase family 87 protein n=1 Tax=Paludisphaera mucosa TaxID=3030827 RepID=A0ABT6F4I2_9BACT|nr:glycosyltransferase family 87 protein [Paludisphaera mucosa]MDG3002497.1 glycosyltransferase family 87 protein [Paludisphaera mucosa]
MAHPDEPGSGDGWNRAPRIRRDAADARPAPEVPASERRRPWLLGLTAILMVVFSAPPLTNLVRGEPNKDYSLWYQVGAAMRDGLEIYPDPDANRLFPFMYPPSAAALLGYVSYLGPYATGVLLVLAHSLAWLGAVLLSVRLATAGGAGMRNPILYVVPSLVIIALIHNTYLLGQPNLTLLMLLLAAFLCLQKGRDGWAGVLVATGAAIKAFPILALGYFVYRRRWRASAATVVALAAWLLVVPLAFRTPPQAVRDVKVWAGGMLFTYNKQGIAQRPFRSFSYKNQSIMAMAHRLLRDVPADGEAVLAKRVAAIRRERKVGESDGVRRDGSFDLKTMLTAPPQGSTALATAFAGIDEDLKKAWKVNVASWDFRSVTLATLAGMAALGLFTLAVLPRDRERTPRTDALEFALVTLLIVMFSPLSFNYAFVWLIYPATVALNEAFEHPAADPRRRAIGRAWLALILLLPATAIAFPLYAQAYGNLFVPALLLVLTLGWTLHEVRRESKVDETAPARRNADSTRLAAGAETSPA